MLQIPFDPTATPFIIFIGCVATCSGLIFLRLLLKFWQKRTKIMGILSINFMCWFVATGGYFAGLLEWFITNDRQWMYKLSLPLGYSLIIIATFITLLFANEFLEMKPWTRKIVMITFFVYMVALVISLFNFEANRWGALPPIPDYRLINLVLMILGNICVFSVLVVKFWKLQQRINNPLYKATIRYLWLYYLFSLTSFCLMVTSEIHLMLIPNPPVYGPFEYVAWVFALLAFIAGYIGLTQPDWFKRKVTKPD